MFSTQPSLAMKPQLDMMEIVGMLIFCSFQDTSQENQCLRYFVFYAAGVQWEY